MPVTTSEVDRAQLLDQLTEQDVIIYNERASLECQEVPSDGAHDDNRDDRDCSWRYLSENIEFGTRLLHLGHRFRFISAYQCIYQEY